MTRITLYIDRKGHKFPQYPWLIKNIPRWDELVEFQFGLEYEMWKKGQYLICLPDEEHINHL